MRKRLKLKKHSCALCKPWKMHGSNRWKPGDLALLKEFEKDKVTVSSSNGQDLRLRTV